jgi:hypothetical protein
MLDTPAYPGLAAHDSCEPLTTTAEHRVRDLSNHGRASNLAERVLRSASVRASIEAWNQPRSARAVRVIRVAELHAQ